MLTLQSPRTYLGDQTAQKETAELKVHSVNNLTEWGPSRVSLEKWTWEIWEKWTEWAPEYMLIHNFSLKEGKLI